MVKKYHLTDHNTSEHGDKIHFSHLQSGSSDSPSKGCQVILVSFSHFLNETMFAKSFDHARDLTCCFTDERISNVSILKSADVEFPSCNGLEQIKVIPLEEIESPPAPLPIFYRFGYFLKIPDARGRIIDAGDEFQIPSIRRSHQLTQYRQAVNGLLDRGVFHGPRAISMFHPSVVFEKGDLVRDRLDAKNFALLVVHFNGDLFHVMLDARSFNPGVIIRSQLSFKLIRQLSAQESSDIIRLDRMDRRAHQFLIDRLQVLPALEGDVRGIFHLHKTPVVLRRKVVNNRTVFPGEAVELPMEFFRRKGVGYTLRLFKVAYLIKGVVEHFEVDPLFPESRCQFIMTVVIELQTKRRPGRNTQITKSKVFKDEVKIVVKALTISGLQEGFVCLLIMPGFVRRARFHGGEDVYQTRMRTPLGNDFTDAFLFAKRLSALNKIDLKFVFLGNLFSVESNLVSKRLSPFRVVEDAYFIGIKVSRHSPCIANRWYCTGNDDTIKTRQDTLNLIRMAVSKKFHGSLYLQRTMDEYSHIEQAA